MNETTAAMPAAYQELMKELAYHSRKIQEILCKLNVQQSNGLYKRNGLSREGFRGLTGLPSRRKPK